VRLSPKDRALLASWALHGAVGLMLLRISLNPAPPTALEGSAGHPPEAPRARVWLPSQKALKQALEPLQPVLPRRPAPPPAPKVQPKDRISIGPPSRLTARELLLRREDDLTATPRGDRGAGLGEPARPPAGISPTPEGAASSDFRAPVADAPLSDQADAGRGKGRGDRNQSIADSLRRWEDRLQLPGTAGLPSGTGKQVGPLFFDPAGADFTAWVNHFKNEVYRNWIVPQSVFLGLRGRVELQFAVARDGSLNGLRVARSSGTAALDRAAENALVGSHFLPLPADFGPPTVTMFVTFIYNEGAGSS
jgi:TonB family protein